MSLSWGTSSRLFLLPLLLLITMAWPGKAMSALPLTVSWTSTATQVDGFKIERKTGTSGTFATVATVAPNVTSYLDTSIASGTNYCYRLRAYNTAGDSAYTNEACSMDALNQIVTLTVGKTGNGMVSSAQTGIICGTTCSASYPGGTAVTLSATPATGSTLSGWSGGGCSGTGTCVVTLTANTTVTATFITTPQKYTLTVTKVGSGTVSSTPTGISCGTTCSASYSGGTGVTLTATPATGSTFSGWSGGGCSGTGTCVVTLTANTTVTATFITTPQKYTLTVTKVGSGTVSSTPTGISCGTTCSASYSGGTGVTLTATPATGSTFSGWSGGGCSGTGTCVVTLTANTTVTATFTSQMNVKIGVFRPSTGQWFLDLNGNGIFDECGASYCLPVFGRWGTPLVGDWTGTGTVQIGFFEPSTGLWKLDRNANDVWEGCTVDLCLGPIEQSTDLPVVGHWARGTTIDTIGNYRREQGTWRLDYNGNGKFDGCAVDDCTGPFNASSADLPVAGDWNGTGVTEIGVFDPSTRMWRLDLNGNGIFDDCTVDSCLGPFGATGNLPVVGDWNGSGRARVGVFDPSTGMWTLDLNGNGKFDGCQVDWCLGPFGLQGDLPVVGKW